MDFKTIHWWEWNLVNDEADDEYASGTFDSKTVQPTLASNSVLVVQTAMASFVPLVDEAQRSGAAIGITQADYTVDGERRVIDHELDDPSSWEAMLAGQISNFTVSVYALRARTNLYFSWVVYG